MTIPHHSFCSATDPPQHEKDELQERIRLAREAPEKIFPETLLAQRRYRTRGTSTHRDAIQEPHIRIIRESEISGEE